jgi:DNA repair protein RadC
VRPRSFDSASEVAAYLEPRFARARQEVVIALLLDGENRLLDEKVIAEGTPTQATVYVRRVLEEALRASTPSGSSLSRRNERTRLTEFSRLTNM